MPFEHADLFPLIDGPRLRWGLWDGPNSDRSIMSGRGEPGIIRAETRIQHTATKPLQHRDLGPAFDVPNMDGVIASARRREQVAACAKRQASIARVQIGPRQLEMKCFLFGSQVPEANRAVAAKCCHELAGWVKGDRPYDFMLMFRRERIVQFGERSAGGCLPNADFAVPACRSDPFAIGMKSDTVDK